MDKLYPLSAVEFPSGLLHLPGSRSTKALGIPGSPCLRVWKDTHTPVTHIRCKLSSLSFGWRPPSQAWILPNPIAHGQEATTVTHIRNISKRTSTQANTHSEEETSRAGWEENCLRAAKGVSSALSYLPVSFETCLHLEGRALRSPSSPSLGQRLFWGCSSLHRAPLGQTPFLAKSGQTKVCFFLHCKGKRG